MENPPASTDVLKLCRALGMSAAPMVVAGLETTLGFFREVLGIEPFPWLDYLRGIDFHRPVRRETLPALTKLARHTGPTHRIKPFVYFTKPGTSPFSTGTSFERSQFEEFITPRAVPALVSRASGIKFGLTDHVSRLGGGLQYILSRTDAGRLRR